MHWVICLVTSGIFGALGACEVRVGYEVICDLFGKC